VIFRLNTGKINGALYYGNLVFPFPNGAMPPVDDVLKTIEEVVTPIKAVNPGLTNMLRETFVLTRLTSDQSDIAKAGSVLVLYKDGLVLYPCGGSVCSDRFFGLLSGKIVQLVVVVAVGM
jgi:hypothetical protein